MMMTAECDAEQNGGWEEVGLGKLRREKPADTESKSWAKVVVEVVQISAIAFKSTWWLSAREEKAVLWIELVKDRVFREQTFKVT